MIVNLGGNTLGARVESILFYRRERYTSISRMIMESWMWSLRIISPLSPQNHIQPRHRPSSVRVQGFKDWRVLWVDGQPSPVLRWVGRDSGGILSLVSNHREFSRGERRIGMKSLGGYSDRTALGLRVISIV
jgi:hypothetical protein